MSSFRESLLHSLLHLIVVRLISCCQVLVHEPWPMPNLFVPRNSNIQINCSNGHTWQIDIATDHTQFQHQFNSNDSIAMFKSNGIYDLSRTSAMRMLLINDTTRNNGTIIYCGSAQSTTVVVFEPVPLTVKVSEINVNSAIISWSPVSAEQNFSLMISRESKSELLHFNQPYYYFSVPDDATPCEVYNFSVSAAYVGATYTGDYCSVPSKVISVKLPSLPNISSLESSFNYTLEKKSAQGFVLNVSFLPSTNCDSDFVFSYVLKVEGPNAMMYKSEANLMPPTGNLFVDNLLDDSVYNFSIIISNDVGNLSSSKTTFYTTDVQIVRAVPLIDDNALMLECMFVTGSDAVGCLVVLQFIRETDSNMVKLIREGMHSRVIKTVHLTKSLTCITQIFGYDIEYDGLVTRLAVPSKLSWNVSLLNCDSSDKVEEDTPSKVIFMATFFSILGSIMLLITLTLMLTSVYFRFKRSQDDEIMRLPSVDPPNSQAPVPSEVKPNSSKLEQSIELHDNVMQLKLQNATGRAPGDGAADCTYYNTIQHQHEFEDVDTHAYAQCVDYKEHIYHVLECNSALKGIEVILPDPDAPELPPPFKEESPAPPPIYHDISDLPGREAALSDYTDHILTSECGHLS